MNKQFYEGVWNVKHIRDNKIIHESNNYNALLNDGEEMLLKTFFQGNTEITTFYMRLATDKLTEGDGLVEAANLEPSSNGYAAYNITKDTAGFPTVGYDASQDWYIQSVTATFTASGGTIGPVVGAFLASGSSNSGKLISYVPFSSARSILDGDVLELTMKVTLR